jgi:hemerythrin
MSLAWREQLSVGNDLIDSDHKYLIEIINQAEQGLKTRCRESLMAALDNLSRYSACHFIREEAIAHAVGYPEASGLHTSHEGLLAKLEQVRQEIDLQGGESSLAHFGVLLREWLINHVIKEDMLMKPYLKKFSPRFDPR